MPDSSVLVEACLGERGVGALGELLEARLVTRDGPLWRRNRKLGLVLTPAALIAAREAGAQPGDP